MTPQHAALLAEVQDFQAYIAPDWRLRSLFHEFSDCFAFCAENRLYISLLWTGHRTPGSNYVLSTIANPFNVPEMREEGHSDE